MKSVRTFWINVDTGDWDSDIRHEYKENYTPVIEKSAFDDMFELFRTESIRHANAMVQVDKLTKAADKLAFLVEQADGYFNEGWTIDTGEFKRALKEYRGEDDN